MLYIYLYGGRYMKRMKQIANELNVTKMTVYNNAKKASVNFQKVDNVNYLSSEDEFIVVNKIKKNQNKNDYFDNEKKEGSKPNDDTLVKDETIKHLYNQLDIYKEQSNRDKEQINTLNRLLENQQILALESNKKIQKLENQLEEERQLNYTFDPATSDRQDRQNTNAQESIFTKKYQNVNQKSDKDQATEKQNENKLSEVIGDYSDNKEEQQGKKGFWSRLFKN